MRANRNEYMARWQRENRAKWKVEGKCCDCGNAILETKVYCKKCNDRHNRLAKGKVQRRKERGACVRCGRPRTDDENNLCPVCRSQTLATETPWRHG